jgi:hypothetical protein
VKLIALGEALKHSQPGRLVIVSDVLKQSLKEMLKERVAFVRPAGLHASDPAGI